MICWIHGAYSSPIYFNYLLQVLPDHDYGLFSYSCDVPLRKNLDALTQMLERGNFTHCIGHSLGGLMAATMYVRGHVPSAVSIASPLAGFKAGNFFPFPQVVSDTRSGAPLFKELSQATYDENYLNIVAIGGSRPGTDGVVPLYSQRALPNQIELHYNHFDIIMAPETAQVLEAHLFE